MVLNFLMSVMDCQGEVPGNNGFESLNLPPFVQSSRLTGTGTRSYRHNKKPLENNKTNNK